MPFRRLMVIADKDLDDFIWILETGLEYSDIYGYGTGESAIDEDYRKWLWEWVCANKKEKS